MLAKAERPLIILGKGAAYAQAVRRGLLNIADQFGLTLVADEIYRDVAFAGPVAPIGSLDSDAPIISLSGLSKGYLVPGWRTGWVVVGGGERLKEVLGAITRLAEGRLCSTMPMHPSARSTRSIERSCIFVFAAIAFGVFVPAVTRSARPSFAAR